MLEKIREILSVQLNMDPEDIDDNADFRDDLGIDSLDLTELVMELEEEYGLEIPADDLKLMNTIKDVAGYFHAIGID